MAPSVARIAASVVVGAGSLLGGVGVATAAPVLDNSASYCELLASTGHIGNCGTLFSYGRGVCYQFDDGYDWYNVLTNLDSAVGRGDSAAILVTAVSELCPWHESRTP
jgi:Protein of unknown function (DUF732)